LPSANGQHLAKDDGGATSVAWCILPRVVLCECLTLGKENVCRVSLFAECWVRHSAKTAFAECVTRQTVSLPSASVSTLGKASSTRQRARLPSWRLGKPPLQSL
jgi:hypothetical protein